MPLAPQRGEASSDMQHLFPFTFSKSFTLSWNVKGMNEDNDIVHLFKN